MFSVLLTSTHIGCLAPQVFLEYTFIKRPVSASISHCPLSVSVQSRCTNLVPT